MAQPFDRLFSAVRNIFKPDQAHKRAFDFKAVNGILIAAIALLGAYLFQMVIGSARKVESLDFGIPEESRTASVPADQDKQVMQPISEYLESVQQRNIFRMGLRAKPDNVADALSSKASEAAQHLRLVGISWSDDPDAMVEDTKAQKTFFVKRGQLIGDLKVEAIYKEKIVLRYGQELLELR